jgi:uncharacterized protein
MTLYVDSSALLKRYIQEPDSDRVDELLSSDSDLVTARHTVVEVRCNLVRQLTPAEATAARGSFSAELAHISIIELDEATCELAATVAEQTHVRALDALHLGAARRMGTAISFLTFDVRQAEAARSLGFRVLGS